MDLSLDPSKWISPRCRVEDSRLRLFCLPHAGSGTAAYNSWRRVLPSFVELCPIQLPGRESRLAEASFTQSEELIHHLSEALTGWLDKPYVIFGHSMGALLSFELANSLRDRGLPQPLHLFLSGRIAAHLPLRGRPIHQLPLEEFLAELERRYDGMPQEILADPDMMELFLPILRADLTLLESYTYRERPPFTFPISVFAGAQDHSVSPESLAAWSQHTTGAFQLQHLPGGHFYLAAESRAALLTILADKLIEADESALSEPPSSATPSSKTAAANKA
jgi:surfactin synthase thioesterase subunit